jgi:hypothetical protein
MKGSFGNYPDSNLALAVAGDVIVPKKYSFVYTDDVRGILKQYL